MKKKAASRKKKSPSKSAAARKGASRKAAARKAPKKKASSGKATRTPPRKQKTKSHAGKRPVPPSARPQPMSPGNGQPTQFAGQEDQHGPMHIPSQKPAPAYAEMHQNDWAGRPPQHEIPVPKR